MGRRSRYSMPLRRIHVIVLMQSITFHLDKAERLRNRIAAAQVMRQLKLVEDQILASESRNTSDSNKPPHPITTKRTLSCNHIPIIASKETNALEMTVNLSSCVSFVESVFIEDGGSSEVRILW
jgi:hypothetical protein